MKLIVDNLAVEYADEGQGPVLLFLHGWADNLHTFDALARELPDWRIIRPDLPGFGGSERPKDAWGVGEYARFVASFCSKMHVEPHVLIGHSFGGRVIMKGVGAGTLAPQKIILIASAGVASRRTWRNEALRALAKAGKALTAWWPLSIWRQALRRRLYLRIGSDYFAAGSMKDIFLKVIGEDLLPLAEKITTPALLIWGTRDRSTPLENGERIHAAIGGSELKVLEGATHFVHKERPQEVARLIRAFL